MGRIAKIGVIDAEPLMAAGITHALASVGHQITYLGRTIEALQPGTTEAFHVLIVHVRSVVDAEAVCALAAGRAGGRLMINVDFGSTVSGYDIRPTCLLLDRAADEATLVDAVTAALTDQPARTADRQRSAAFTLI